MVAWGLPMMFSVPLFSRDVYAYIGQGRLMVEGFNPYENGISALSNYFQLGADKMWTEAPVPYGQLFLWIEQFVVWSTNVHPEASIMLFRLAALVGVVLCVDLRAQTRRTARRQPAPGAVADGGQPAVPDQLHRQRPQRLPS